MNINFNPAARTVEAPGQAMAFNWPANVKDETYAKLVPASRIYWDGKDFIIRTPPTVPPAVMRPFQEAIVKALAKKQPLKLTLMYDGFPEDQPYFVVFAPSTMKGKRCLAEIYAAYMKATVEYAAAQEACSTAA